MQEAKICQACGRQNLYSGIMNTMYRDITLCLNCFINSDHPDQYGIVFNGFTISEHQPTDEERQRSAVRDELVKQMKHDFKTRYNLFPAEEKRVAAYGENHRDQINIGDIAEGRQDEGSVALRNQARIDKQAILDIEAIQYWPKFDVVKM